MPGAPPPKKSYTGLIIGGCLGLLVLGGGAIAAVVYLIGSEGKSVAHAGDIVASCDLRGGSSSSSDSQLCMDLTTVNEKVRDICSKYKFSTRPCDRKGALGGCASGSSITWNYPDSKHKTANDVKKECSETFVTTSWK